MLAKRAFLFKFRIRHQRLRTKIIYIAFLMENFIKQEEDKI